MAYATQADIVELYSEDALVVADRNHDGVIDSDAVEKALKLATGEINSFIGVRYTLPLPATPDLLLQFCVDIALYRLASTRDMLSEEHRTRYTDAKDHLKLISKGVAALDLPAPVSSGDDGDAVELEGPRPIVSGGPEREFTRAKMRGL
jgi:phage gp36-like protein